MTDGPEFTTMSGVPVNAVYGGDPLPGEFPYTRGIHPGMYRDRLWTMRMFAGFGTAGTPTAASRNCYKLADPACPPPSTCPPLGDVTPITNGRSVRWAGLGWP